MKVLQILMIDFLACCSLLDSSLDSSFSNKLLGVEEMISRNLIYFHLLIDFSLSSFLMKKNHRLSSLPQTFSVQFSVLHPLDHRLCMILPSESSPLPLTKLLLCFYLSEQTLAELLFFSGPSCYNFFSPGHITTSEYIQKSADILL